MRLSPAGGTLAFLPHLCFSRGAAGTLPGWVQGWTAGCLGWAGGARGSVQAAHWPCWALLTMEFSGTEATGIDPFENLAGESFSSPAHSLQNPRFLKRVFQSWCILFSRIPPTFLTVSQHFQYSRELMHFTALLLSTVLLKSLFSSCFKPLGPALSRLGMVLILCRASTGVSLEQQV